MNDFLVRNGVAVLIAGLGLSTLFFTLAFAASAIGKSLRIGRRLERVATAEEKAKRNAAIIPQGGSNSSIAWLDSAIKRWVPRPEQMRDKLAATGLRIRLGEYVLVSLLAGVTTNVVLKSFAHLPTLIALLFSVALALGLPHLVVNILVARRVNRFMVLFPDAIDLMVRGIKAGLPITESIRSIGEELPDPVGMEFRRIVDSFKLGFTMDEALQAAFRRLRSREFHFFIISLAVQRETGGNLAETLDNLGTILRKRKQMKLKIRAMSSEARASAGIIGSLPVLAFFGLFFFKPDYVMPLLDDPRGHMLLASAVLSMVLGAGIMMKMARFEI